MAARHSGEPGKNLLRHAALRPETTDDLTVCLLAVPVVFTSAEDATDLSSLNEELLVALLAEVQSEIVARHIEKTASLPAGTCIGGRDVPAGPCVLAAAGTGDDDCWPYVIITGIMNDAREASRRYGSR